jgi:hypothetical protein
MLAAPYKTIGKAASVINAGETCYIRSGTYREQVTLTRSGASGSPIRFENYPGETVTLDGTDTPSLTWTQHSGNIYVADTTGKGLNHATLTQLFLSDQMMQIARWPNSRFPEDLWNVDARWASARDGSADGIMVDSGGSHNLAATGIDFTGGLAVLQVSHNYYVYTRTISSHGANSNTFTYPLTNSTANSMPWNDDRYYIMGMGGSAVLLATLDSPGEWLLDSANNKLYLYTPNGTSPSNFTVRVKQRNYGFTGTGLNYVQIKGLDFFGCMARLKNSNNCLYENCDFNYPNFWINLRPSDGAMEWQDEYVSIVGSSNTIRNCRSYYASNSGFGVTSAWGRTDTGSTVENCLVENASWFGEHNCPGISISALSWQGVASNFTGRNNTVRNVGAIGIFFNAIPSLLEYNEVDNACKIGFQDSTAVYTTGDSAGSKVRYNWVHDIVPYKNNTGPEGYWGNGIGIRVDDSGNPIELYNNAVWNVGGAGINLKGDLHKVYNNVVLNVGSLVTYPAYIMMQDQGAGAQNASSQVYNNFSKNILRNWNGQAFAAGTQVGTNRTANDPLTQFVDPNKRDFRPKATGVIDKGTILTGYTDGYLGTAPDIGVYENGAAYWIPGFKDSVVTDPVPADNSTVPTSTNTLLWRPAYQATAQNV